MNKVALVTGATSGIGLELVRNLSGRGYRVYGVARNYRELDCCEVITADVSSETEIEKAVNAVMDKEGRIDLLICNAGFGISGPVEYTKVEDARRQFDVNFFGFFICAKKVLPVFRKQGHGRIVVTSSVAGAISIPFQAFYSASKASINSLVMAMRNEVSSFGVKVTAVMPGDTRTSFTAKREKDWGGDNAYSEIVRRSIEKMEKDEQNGADASKVAAYIAKVAEKKNPKPVYTAGFGYKVLVVLSKILPSRLVNYIVGKMYT
jgi:short-subunit dehydrogenase